MKKILSLLFLCIFIIPTNVKAATITDSCISKGTTVNYSINKKDKITITTCNYISLNGNSLATITYEPNDKVFKEVNDKYSAMNHKTFEGVGDGSFTLTIVYYFPTTNPDNPKKEYSYVNVNVGAQQYDPPISTPKPPTTPTPSPSNDPTPKPSNDPTPSPSNTPTPSPSNTPTPKPTTNKSNNNYLSSLSVENYPLNETFNKMLTTYNLTIPNNITSINIKATPEHSKATIKNIGIIDISNKNSIDIIVLAEDGNEKKYTINLNRINESDANLKNLSVKGYKLNKIFNQNELNYSITVPYNTTFVTIEAIKEYPEDTLKITGNNNLTIGNNLIEITVTNKNGKSKTYTINAIRQKQTVDTPIQNNNSNNLSLYLIIGITATVIVLGSIIVYSIIKAKKKNKIQ